MNHHHNCPRCPLYLRDSPPPLKATVCSFGGYYENTSLQWGYALRWGGRLSVLLPERYTAPSAVTWRDSLLTVVSKTSLFNFGFFAQILLVFLDFLLLQLLKNLGFYIVKLG